jgi:hypothetical protein
MHGHSGSVRQTSLCAQTAVHLQLVGDGPLEVNHSCWSCLQELEYCQAVVLSVTDEVGIRTIMDQLMESTRSDKVELRRSSVMLLCAFCRHTHADYSQYVPQLLRGLIHLFTDKNRDVLQMAWEALSAVTKVNNS